MAKITIINSGFCANKGDAGILYGAITSLNKYFNKDTTYLIESAWDCHGGLDMFRYINNEINTYPPLWKNQTTLTYNIKSLPIPNVPGLLEGVIKIPVLLEINKNKEIKYFGNFLSRYNKELIDQMSDSDLIISCAGGSFHDREGGYAFLKLLYSLGIAVNFNVPVMIYAQSIGPFHNAFCEKITRKVLDKLDFITIRDFYSKEYIKKMGVKTPVEVTADAAFALPNPFETEFNKDINEYMEKYNWIKDSTFNIGVTTRDWNLNNCQRERYITAMASLVKYLCNNYEDAIITFFPQTLSDISFSRSICYYSSFYNKKCFVIEDDLHPMVLKGLYAKMNLFIGTRMHSTIFAMSMNIPTISIAYMPKSVDLMRRLNLEDFAFSIYNIDESKIIKSINRVIQEESRIRQHLKKVMRHMHTSSLKNAEFAYKLSKREFP